jgi:bifunctional DNase/RNase
MPPEGQATGVTGEGTAVTGPGTDASVTALPEDAVVEQPTRPIELDDDDDDDDDADDDDDDDEDDDEDDDDDDDDEDDDEDDDDDDDDDEDDEESFSVVRVARIQVDLPAPHAVIVLREIDEPERRLAIPVGVPEATGLAHAWRSLATARPLTHELFAEVLVRLGATIDVVRLIGRRAGVVLAEIEISSPRGRERVPCRPTDALTLALRQKVPAPILVDERLFAAEGDVEPHDR